MFTLRLRTIFYRFFQSDWAVALLIFAVFIATNGYTLGWDDQHLEIPLLKHLINPQLYAGDYYVESLKQNFPSFLFPLLARVISVQQIPAAYLILFVISRYIMFYWIYRLWYFLSREKFVAILCSLHLFLIGRVPELLYRTFSHEEFALAIVFAGIYYFYKDRYALAALLLGIAMNFHAIYSVFPFTYMMLYLVLNYKEVGWKTILSSGIITTVCACPFIVWFISHHTHPLNINKDLYSGWYKLYLEAGPQNFIFADKTLPQAFKDWPTFLSVSYEYISLLGLYLTNFFFNKNFRSDRKTQAVLLGALILLVISFIFTYIFPTFFVLNLNLIRNTQFLLFFLLGYLVMTLVQIAKEERIPWVIFILSVFALTRFPNYIHPAANLALLFLLAFKKILPQKPGVKRGLLLGATLFGALGSLSIVCEQFILRPYQSIAIYCLWSTWLLFIAGYIFFIRTKKISLSTFKKILLTIPFIVCALYNVYYHYEQIQMRRTSGGFWQLQRNWIDMQEFVKAHTPQDAFLLTPYDMEMGGFRIFSDRKVLVCYRDIGIIGFDYKALLEWKQRIQDVESFKVYIDRPLSPAIANAIFKYHVNYIVFMRYAAPKPNKLLSLLYFNETFALYRVNNLTP